MFLILIIYPEYQVFAPAFELPELGGQLFTIFGTIAVVFYHVAETIFCLDIVFATCGDNFRVSLCQYCQTSQNNICLLGGFASAAAECKPGLRFATIQPEKLGGGQVTKNAAY